MRPLPSTFLGKTCPSEHLNLACDALKWLAKAPLPTRIFLGVIQFGNTVFIVNKQLSGVSLG